MKMKNISIYFILLILLLCTVATAETHGEEVPPAGLSKKELLKWEVEHIPVEQLVVREDGNTIYLNNKYCPLQHREIQNPIDYISRSLVYKGKNPKFKGKTFVVNFCCGVCRQRFADHFDKFADEILKRYGVQ